MSKTITKDVRRAIHLNNQMEFKLYDVCAWLKETDPTCAYSEGDVSQALRYLAVETAELVRRGHRGNWTYSKSMISNHELVVDDKKIDLISDPVTIPVVDPITRLIAAIHSTTNANHELNEAIINAEVMMNSFKTITDAISNAQ